jgi:hypothetical protein
VILNPNHSLTRFSISLPQSLINTDINQRLKFNARFFYVFSGFVFPEDEENEDRNGDLVKFSGTKKYLGLLNKTVDSYEKEKVCL